ncbi:MAG: beta-N-acetylhexosaminidase [Symbiobacterium sp.]|uniref:beta-N-acetylhexosaminidase n=1 Tax=Symbiobacterium sp. TaxID=1971213 RepID=UPI0034646E14
MVIARTAALQRILAAALSALVAVSTPVGCGRGGAPSPGAPPQGGAPPAEEPGGSRGEEPAPVSAVPDWLDYLTLEEKLGQLFWVGLPGAELTPETEELLAEGKVGGYILFGRQGSDPERLRRLTASLQAAAAARERATPGLVIAVDHEGGLVQRFGPPFTQWPGNMALGATGSEEYAEQVGRAMARELLAVGVNMNLAPVADVNNNPANPVIGTRSFGEDPALVARLAAALARGLQAEGVSAVAKHFPGHGDTDVDSHLDLPVVGHDRERLDQVELRPFRAAIAGGVDAVMAAHVVFPAVAQDGRPATLSPSVLNGLLKEELGFPGVVITDSMDGMAAITDHYGVAEGLVLAVQAGADVVLVTESFGVQRSLYDKLLQAVREGRIPESRIDDAAGRVLALKERQGLLPPLPGKATAGEAGGAGGEVSGGAPREPARLTGEQPLAEPIGPAAHQALAEQIGADALTLVRNAHLPLQPSAGDRIVVIGPAYARPVTGVDGVATALGASIRALHENTIEITLDYRPDEDALAAAREIAEEADVVIYAVSEGHDVPGHRDLIADLVAGGRPVVVVGLGMPYELTAIPEIGTYIAAYGYQDVNLKGIGPLLFGRAPAKGRLPVSVPGLYPAGHGLDMMLG